MKNKTRYFAFTAAWITLAAFSSLGQILRPSFDRPHDYDVQHYKIGVSFERSIKRVSGDTTVTFKPTKENFRSIEFDAVGLNFASVSLEPMGTPLQYKVGPRSVVVQLDKAYTSADSISVRFKYTTTAPKKGIYFRDAEAGTGGHSEQIWTQGEAEEARYWFPSFDFPSDKATTEELITAEKDNTVVGNGELLARVDNGNGTATWHYKMPVPHSTYLVSFVIGKYSKIADKFGEVPLSYFTYPGRESTALKAFGKTPKMMEVFEQLTGVKFPYNKYDQTVVAKFQFGGMENITATTMSDQDIGYVEIEGFGEGVVTDLVSHELAHSWFGDLVTCRNWAELWLNEGFATYMEAAYREKAFGRDNYIAKVRSDAADFLVDDAINRKRHGLFNQRAGNVDGLFDNASITYHKGGAVVHQLREQVGTENFWKGINNYLNAHRFANVESTDLKKAMEEASGQDLTWFFNQWVYGVGAPRLTVTPVYSSRTKTLKLTIVQVIRPDPNAPVAFRLPMNISVDGKSTSVDLTKKVETITIKTDAKPNEIIIDPDDKIVLRTVKMLPIQTIR